MKMQSYYCSIIIFLVETFIIEEIYNKQKTKNNKKKQINFSYTNFQLLSLKSIKNEILFQIFKDIKYFEEYKDIKHKRI